MTLFFTGTGALEGLASVAALTGSATCTGGGVLGSWTFVSSVEVEGALSGNQSNKYQNQRDGSVAKLTSVDLVFGINWVVDMDREVIFRRRMCKIVIRRYFSHWRYNWKPRRGTL